MTGIYSATTRLWTVRDRAGNKASSPWLLKALWLLVRGPGAVAQKK